MATKAQNKATAKYRKRNVKEVKVRFFPAEANLWEHLEAQENKAGYIKGLIRKDMEGGDPCRS